MPAWGELQKRRGLAPGSQSLRSWSCFLLLWALGWRIEQHGLFVGAALSSGQFGLTNVCLTLFFFFSFSLMACLNEVLYFN